MPRIAILIIVLVLVIGGLVFLSTQAREVPTTTIETDVSPAANAQLSRCSDRDRGAGPGAAGARAAERAAGSAGPDAASPARRQQRRAVAFGPDPSRQPAGRRSGRARPALPICRNWSCRLRRRRSSFPAMRAAIRGSSAASIRCELGLGSNPWGAASGAFLSGLMRRMDTPIASRWAHIALRNALLARARAPRNVNPVDWAAERAWLLLRMGEADAARMLVSGVDVDRFTPKMFQVAVQSALANADPPGAVPARGGLAQGRAAGPAAGRGDVRVACRASRRAPPPRSIRRAAAGGSAESTSCWPRRSSARAPTPAAR